MIGEYIINIGLDVVKDKVLSVAEKTAIRERMRKFIKRQNKINLTCTLEEEIDFEGLSNYICTDLLSDVLTWLYGNKGERGQARKLIISKAIQYSQSQKALSRNRTIKLTEAALNILYDYYRVKSNKELLFLEARIEDTIIENLKDQTEALTNLFDKNTKNIKNAISDTSNMSIDNNVKLLESGKISEVEANVSTWLNAVSTKHELYPCYGFKLREVKGNHLLYSVPLSNEAIQKYPPKISCTATFMTNGKYIHEIDTRTIEHANRHQLTITVNVLTAKKLLGDFIDPSQHEVDGLIGKNLLILPKPFPPAFPCSILLNGDTFFDYILLRVQEILDNGEIVLSNLEQTNIHLKVNMIVNLHEKKLLFKFFNENPTNEELLRYVRFIKCISNGAKIVVKALSLEEIFAYGQIEDLEYHCGFNEINDEISFLESIVAIERYFKDRIVIPPSIYQDDFDTITNLSSLIQKRDCYGTWKKLKFSKELSEDLKQVIKDMKNVNLALSYVTNISVPLYGKIYDLSIERQLDSSIVLNLQKLKQKADILDIGDEITFNYIPSDNRDYGTCVDKLYV